MVDVQSIRFWRALMESEHVEQYADDTMYRLTIDGEHFDLAVKAMQSDWKYGGMMGIGLFMLHGDVSKNEIKFKICSFTFFRWTDAKILNSE